MSVSSREESQPDDQVQEIVTSAKKIPQQSLVSFLQRLFRKFRVLKCLSSQQRQKFETEVIKLLVDEDKNIDQTNYRLLVEQCGVQAFVLQMLAECLERNKKDKLQSDLKEIDQILQEKLANIARKEKILQEKEVKHSQRQQNIKNVLKNHTQLLQKQSIQAIAKIQQEFTKRINGLLRTLKVKEDVVRQKIAELDAIKDKYAKIEQQQKKIKEKVKIIQRKQDQFKKKQNQMAAIKTAEIKMSSEVSSYKSKLEEMNKKLNSVTHLLNEKAKILAMRDNQITKLKSSLAESEQTLENLKKTKRETPIKKLPEQLNISDIVPKDVSALSQSKSIKYIDLIDQLVQKIPNKASLNEQTVIKLAQVVSDHIEHSLNASKKAILHHIQHNNLIVKHLKPQKYSSQCLVTQLILLFCCRTSKELTNLLDSIYPQLDEDKWFLVIQGHLHQIVEKIVIPQIYDQNLNNSTIQLLLRCIQNSPIYCEVLAKLSQPMIFDYLQTVFQKYEMEDSIIQNLSVVMSRCCLAYRGKPPFRQLFIKSLKRKIKMLDDGLAKQNLKSILDIV